MSIAETPRLDGSNGNEAWAWWQARRLRYNIALGCAGWAAYGLNALLFYAAGRRIWQSWQGAVSMTLFLGIVFLLAMGVANVCYLLGPTVEAALRPTDVLRFRRAAFAMGFWGSIAVPFAFPAANLAQLIGSAK